MLVMALGFRRFGETSVPQAHAADAHGPPMRGVLIRFALGGDGEWAANGQKQSVGLGRYGAVADSLKLNAVYGTRRRAALQPVAPG